MNNQKRRKNTRHRGSHTAGRGFKKKARGSGHRGGIGNAGSGKRADQKKNLIKRPFGKRKTLRKKTVRKLKCVSLRQIQEDFDTSKEIKLIGYKVLSQGEVNTKLKIIAAAASKTAIDKVKKAGGDITISPTRK